MKIKIIIAVLLILWGCVMQKGQVIKNKHTGRIATIEDIITVNGAKNPVYVINGERWDSEHIVHWEAIKSSPVPAKMTPNELSDGGRLRTDWPR